MANGTSLFGGELLGRQGAADEADVVDEGGEEERQRQPPHRTAHPLGLGRWPDLGFDSQFGH